MRPDAKIGQWYRYVKTDDPDDAIERKLVFITTRPAFDFPYLTVSFKDGLWHEEWCDDDDLGAMCLAPDLAIFEGYALFRKGEPPALCPVKAQSDMLPVKLYLREEEEVFEKETTEF